MATPEASSDFLFFNSNAYADNAPLDLSEDNVSELVVGPKTFFCFKVTFTSDSDKSVKRFSFQDQTGVFVICANRGFFIACEFDQTESNEPSSVDVINKVMSALNEVELKSIGLGYFSQVSSLFYPHGDISYNEVTDGETGIRLNVVPATSKASSLAITKNHFELFSLCQGEVIAKHRVRRFSAYSDDHMQLINHGIETLANKHPGDELAKLILVQSATLFDFAYTIPYVNYELSTNNVLDS